MATVDLTQDLKHKRRVAPKVLDPELGEVLGAERFTREIETVAQLQHPHIQATQCGHVHNARAVLGRERARVVQPV